VCVLISTYLGIFQFAFCYWFLALFHYGQKRYLYGLVILNLLSFFLWLSKCSNLENVLYAVGRRFSLPSSGRERYGLLQIFLGHCHCEMSQAGTGGGKSWVPLYWVIEIGKNKLAMSAKLTCEWQSYHCWCFLS
jgi:hypothetical protein